MSDRPPFLHIVGPKNSGKTRLTEWLIRSLTDCGLKVGALKHSMHSHPVDKSGADSDRLRRAGAFPAAFWSENGLGIYYPPLASEKGWQILQNTFARCDLVLVESFASAPHPKIVLQDDEGIPTRFDNVIALISNRKIETELPVFKPDEKKRLIDFILKYFRLQTQRNH